MFYPNFSRRTLALILSCLVITLGGVGLLLLIYIFNETSSLLSGPLEKISYSNLPYTQSVIKSDEHKFDKKFRNQRTQEVKAYTNRANAYKNRSIYIPTPSEGRVLSISTNRVEDNKKIHFIDLSRKEAKTTDSTVDTIYIDDFDSSSYNGKSKNDISNIDYFDVILVDHKVDTNPNTLNNIPTNSMKYKSIILEAINNNNKKYKYKKEKKVSKENHKYNTTKILIKAIEARNRSDEDKLRLSDTDSTGSGSGDYTDDTELNEIDAKTVYTGNNIATLLQKNSVSSLSRLTTASYSSNTIKEFVNRKGSTDLTSHQDFSSYFTAELKSAFPNETDKEISHANSLTRYNELIYNDSYPSLPTFQYNNLRDNVRISVDGQAVDNSPTKLRNNDIDENGVSWIETRTRRIMGNVKKSEERSRQLLLCEEAGGGELCRMLFKEHVND